MSKGTIKITKQKPSFRVHFNKGKQWFDVYIASSSRKFMGSCKCWAYYHPILPRKNRKGKFGEIHLSRTGAGLVSHELLHLLIDWIKVGRSKKITDRNEEAIVEMFGEMVRRLWLRYYSWKEHTSI